MGFFEHVPLAPPDPILGLTAAFLGDTRENKVNLGVGLYKTEDLRTPVLECVKMAEVTLLRREKSKGYLPIDGDRLYLDGMGELVFGEREWSEQKGRISAFQTVGGTGALKIGGTFLKEEGDHPLWISMPTWPNHFGVFSHCGLQVESYPYYDSTNHKISITEMVACLEKLPPGAAIVLHAACHNPTGCDLSHAEWKMLSELFQARQLIPFFDFAYQGFGLGLEEDAEAIRHFLGAGVEMLVAVSNAKNLSLYGERVGCLFIVSETQKPAAQISSRVKQMIRTNYSSPPMHGARVAALVLNTPTLKQKWGEELNQMRARILAMRRLFVDKLAVKAATFDFSHLARGSGMFGFTGLNKDQVERMQRDYGIYMPVDGRMNVCGLNHSNIDYVVDALIAASQENH
jgi:aspartate/tyrosine/aromatic aminotransferase